MRATASSVEAACARGKFRWDGEVRHLSRAGFLRGCGAALGLVAIWAVGADRPETVQAMALAREGAAAAEADDKAGYLAKMEAAVALRGDFPYLLENLAAAQLAHDRGEDAIATLEKLAALGAYAPVERSPEFAALRGRNEFTALAKKFAANLHPKGEGEIAFSLPEMTGILEGIAWREKTGEFFFGDPHHRCVWVRTPAAKGSRAAEGQVRRFTAENAGLWGVFGLVVDEERGVLWAATSAVPAMAGYSAQDEGAAGLAEIDLATGEVRRVIPPVPKRGARYSSVLGDLALARDGTVYLPDSGGPMVWRLSPGAGALELVAESAEFLSLQGAVVADDGSALFLADQANGVLRLDLNSNAVQRLESPPQTTLVGIDGLVRAGNGDLIAIQSRLRPSRVLRLALAPGGEAIAAVTVLEAAHLTMAAPALGCVATGGALFFIGHSGWANFDGAGASPTRPRPVPVFRTKR